MDHGRIPAMGTQHEIKQIVGENRLLRVMGSFDKTVAENLPGRIKTLNLISIRE